MGRQKAVPPRSMTVMRVPRLPAANALAVVRAAGVAGMGLRLSGRLADHALPVVRTADEGRLRLGLGGRARVGARAGGCGRAKHGKSSGERDGKDEERTQARL
jgi:hypothetical protein